MASTMNSRKHIVNTRHPALGRRCSLGQLYDCRSENVVRSKFLWESRNISKARKFHPQKSSTYDMLTDDSYRSKISTLGIDKNLQVSILGKLVQLGGSSAYLNDEKKSQQQERVTLMYKCTTKYEELDMDILIKEKLLCPNVFVDGTATHVICGIVYGGQAYFVFDKMFSGQLSDSSSNLIDVVKRLPKLSLDRGNGRLRIPKDLEEESCDIQCKLYCDFPTPYKPNNYRDAAKLFKSLPHFVEGRGASAVPVEILLYPLQNIDDMSAYVMRRVSDNNGSQLENSIRHLDNIVVRCHDMINLLVAMKFPAMMCELQNFQQLVTSYQTYLQYQVGPLITRIRCGSVNENVIEALLRGKEESPFSRDQMELWMQQKQVQLQIISQDDSIQEVDTEVKDTPNASSAAKSMTSSWPHQSHMQSSSTSSWSSSLSSSAQSSSENDLDGDFDFEICFHVNLGGKHSLTKLMNAHLNYLNSGFPRQFASAGTDIRKNSKSHGSETLKRAEQFKGFVEANRFNDGLKFSFVEEKGDNEKPAVYVSVKKEGIVMYEDYQPPTVPGAAKLVQSRHDTLAIKWSEPKVGNTNVTQYEVQYKEISGINGETIQVDKTTVTLNKLKLGSTYDVQVRAVCEIGTSKWSLSSSFRTLPATPPGKPTAAHKIPNDVILTWPKPQEIACSNSDKGYAITIYDVTNQITSEILSDPRNGAEMILSNLNPASSYIFSVRAIFDEGETEDGEKSDLLEPKPNTIMKGKLLSEAKKIKKGSPATYRLKIRNTLIKKNEKIRKCELGFPKDGLTEKVIMVVGATGAGKTTLINGLVNYILGVDWKDNFRFQLIVDSDEAKQRSQALSQTRWITSYTLHTQEGFEVPYSLTLIDTPGFGDTSGIKRDQEITSQIRNFFTSQGDDGIDHIDAIGFVTQASLPRLTPTQRFIFDQVLALFGKDISENIFLLVTFADGQRPPVLEGAKAAEIPYKKYFKFNNSALYADNGQRKSVPHSKNYGISDSDDDDGGFDEMFWNMGEKSFATFFKSLNNTETKSLLLTKDVLNERYRLETHVAGIHQHIRTGLNKLEQLRIEVDVLKRHETDIEMNKDFTYTVTEEAVKSENIPSGTYITNCLQCNFTCHYPCSIPDDANKARCAAMNRSLGICMICPSRCVWNVHKNMTYKFIIESVTKTKTAEELKARYEAASGEKMTAEDLIKKVIDDFENVQLKVLFYTDEVRKSLERLKEIALKPNPLSTVEYIDILIMSEESQKSPGWKDRRQQLEDVRKQAETLQLLAKPGFDPFEEYKKAYFGMRQKGEKEENIFQTVKKMFKNFL